MASHPKLEHSQQSSTSAKATVDILRADHERRMDHLPRTDLFHGLFELWPQPQGRSRLVSNASAPRAIPDPKTGRPLKVASVELSERGVCPACTQLGAGGYVSFVSDLRLAFACPSCKTLVWIEGT